MARTPEQKAVDDALTEAIEAALHAHDAKTGVTSDYIVLVAQQNFDADGESTTSIARLVRDDGIPHYRLLGLLDYAATCYRADLMVISPAQDDDEG